jgi:hypothetical protein
MLSKDILLFDMAETGLRCLPSNLPDSVVSADILHVRFCMQVKGSIASH